MLYLVILFLVLDFDRLVHLVPQSFMVNSVKGSLSVLLLITGLFVYANINYRNKVVQLLTLKTGKQIDRPLKIVMLTDLHLGYHNRRAEFCRWVDKINAEKPDIILIGGDIVDISVRPLKEENVAEEFRRLNVRFMLVWAIMNIIAETLVPVNFIGMRKSRYCATAW